MLGRSAKNMRFSENAISSAAFIFEKHNGNSLTEYELSEIERNGFEDISPDLLVKALKDAVTNDHKSDSTYRQQAYWALGKRYDKALVPFFTDRINIELKRDLIAVYQILVALDSLDEHIFSEHRDGNYDLHEYDLNKQDAENYLTKSNQ